MFRFQLHKSNDLLSDSQQRAYTPFGNAFYADNTRDAMRRALDQERLGGPGFYAMQRLDVEEATVSIRLFEVEEILPDPPKPVLRVKGRSLT